MHYEFKLKDICGVLKYQKFAPSKVLHNKFSKATSLFTQYFPKKNAHDGQR